MLKKIIFVSICLILTTTIFAETKEILFIGNSITYFNELPTTFMNIANSKNDSVSITQHTPGGTGIVDHVENSQLYGTISRGIWDYVVIQPGSGESPGNSFPIDVTLRRTQTLLDSIYHYNPFTQVLFYEISYGVWGNTPENLETYNNTQSQILSNMQYLADETENFLAPVGEAFKQAWNDDTDTMLWGGTGNIHPNAKGSYLAACVFYCSIFQKPSFGTNIYDSINQDDAEFYQQLADEKVLNNKPDWRINTFNHWLDFSINQNVNTIDIVNNSVNLDSYSWDFNDGNNSSDWQPNHTYDITGNYQVTLTAQVTYNSGSQQNVSLSKEVVIDNLVNNQHNDVQPTINNVSIYPNPFNPETTIQFDIPKTGNVKVAIYNSKGQLVRKLSDKNMIKGKHKLVWNGLNDMNQKVATGIYFTKISGKENSEMLKMILMK